MIRLLFRFSYICKLNFHPFHHTINMFFDITVSTSLAFTTEVSSGFGQSTLTYILTYLHTYSMQQSPSWEANWYSASQEIPRILWNPNIHYRVYNSSPPILTLNQSNTVHTPSHFLKTHFNIILSSTLFSKVYYFSFIFVCKMQGEGWNKTSLCFINHLKAKIKPQFYLKFQLCAQLTHSSSNGYVSKY